jgi:hypothetical protein
MWPCTTAHGRRWYGAHSLITPPLSSDPTAATHEESVQFSTATNVQFSAGVDSWDGIINRV